MIYWVVVLGVWITSLALLLYGGFLLFSLLGGKSVNLVELVIVILLGVFLNFLVVNWPTEVGKKGLDEQAIKVLRYLAKVAPLAPKAVREGIEKILEKYA